MRSSWLPRVFGPVVLLLCSTEIAHTSRVSDKPEDPLEVSDLVVQGIVQKAEPGEFSYPTQPADSLRFESVKVTLQVTKILRGSWTSTTIVIVSLHDPEAFVSGKNYIVCAKWYPIKQAFVTAPYMGIYAQDGKQWVRRTSKEYQIKPEVLTQADVSARVDKGTLRSLTRRADLVVTGQIVAVEDSVYSLSNGWHGRMRHFSVTVDQVLKGHSSRGQISFVIPRASNTVLGHQPTPEIAVGERWLLFLRSSDLGFYPFAWRNSLLRIEGDKLIFNSKVTYPESGPQAIARIRQEAQIEKK